MSLQFAREDYKQIVGAGEFSVNCTFTPPGTSPVSKTIKGIYSEINNSVNTDGVPVNAKQTRLTICESDLTAQSYTTRDASNRITLNKHLVVIADISGTNRTYIVNEVIPDRTFGGITIILGDYGS